jgi:twinkle protein
MDMKVDFDKYDKMAAGIPLEAPKRTHASMLVTKSSTVYEAPPRRVLVDLEAMDAKALIARQEARATRFGTTPFDVQGHLLRLYPGGVTIWSGFPGSGKTTILRQFICQSLKFGDSVFLASLEEDPQDALISLAATAEGCAVATRDGIEWFKDVYSKRFRLWGEIGIASHIDLLNTIRELASTRLSHAVIDSLMCLDIANDNFEGQRKFANLVAATARACNVHIHLVAHPRKLVSANQELDLNDVAGARELGGVADNVLFIRRSTNAARDMGPDAKATPMNISIRKQRHFSGAHGEVTGWYRRDFRQFTTDQFATEPQSYLPDEAIKYIRQADAAHRKVAA